MSITRFIRPLKIVGAAYLAYLALMTLVLMPALNVLAPRLYRAQTGRELQLEKIILLNPFTLALTVRNASSDNPDHSRFWSFDKLYANVSLSSLWRRQLVLNALQLQGLSVQIEQTSSERYNFSDILDHQAALAKTAKKETVQETSSAAFPLSIDKIEFNATHLGLRAPHLSEPLALEIGDLTVTIDHLSTVSDSDTNNANTKGSINNTAATNIYSKTIAMAVGRLKADFLRAQQPFTTQIDNLHFTIADFSSALQRDQSYQFGAKFSEGGELQAQGKINLAAQHNSGELHLHDLNLQPTWRYLAPKLAFATEHALLDLDVPYQLQWGEQLRYSVENGRAALRNVQLQSLRDADTQLGFNSLTAAGIAVDSQQPRAQIAKIMLDGLTVHGWNNDAQISLLDMLQFPSDDSPPGPQWQLQIDAVEAQNGQLHWRANQIDVPELLVAPLALQATHIQWPATESAQFNIKTGINNDTQIALAGSINPTDLTGTLSGDISGLPLSWGNRLLGRQISAVLQSGSASTHFELALAQGTPTTLQSEGHIDQFELRRLPDQQKLLAWQTLAWKKLAVDLPAQTLQLAQINATNPWLQFRINADGTNNFQQLLIDQTSSSIVDKAANDKVSTAKPTKIARTLPAAETPTIIGSKTAETTKTTKITKTKPWQFTVRNIHSDNGLLDFRDSSLARPFHTTIADFSGDIDGLSNSDHSLAKVGFKGTVDGYAPVALTGTTNPFAKTPALNVTLDIANLDLSTLTPYSGTYAGYLIDSGRLSVQLVYTLANQRIQGSNHIVVNQLKLGEQVHGPKVMDLPLRFAIYLLTDSNGVMDLGVDVTGNVDDPDFSVSSIIWKAFRNVIVKTAASPFRALAHLVGGVEQDIDRVDFSAGSDAIGTVNDGKLNSLSEALQKKPALHINISGHVSPGQDIEALRDNSLSQQLLHDGIAASDIQQQSKHWQQAVSALYKKRFPADSSGKLAVMEMNDSMRDNVELPPRALDELASRRALAVKQALVTERGVAADRIAIAPIDLGSDKNPSLTATMTIE